MNADGAERQVPLLSMASVVRDSAQRWGVSLIEAADRMLVEEAMWAAGGVQARAAAFLGIGETALAWRAQKYGYGTGRAHWREERVGKARDRRRTRSGPGAPARPQAHQPRPGSDDHRPQASGPVHKEAP